MTSKKFRKLFAIPFVIVLLVMAALAGCSTSNNNEKNTSAPSTDPSSTPTATPEPKERGKISVTMYDRGNIPAAEGTAEDNRWTKWINKEAPVDVKFIPVPRWESGQKLNVLFASGSAPDLILEYDGVIRNGLYAQKQLMPIDELVENSVEYKKYLEENPGIGKLATLDDGKMYYFGRVLGASLNVGLAIRQDWLDKLKLKAPTTPEELLQVAKAFTEQDPDGNNKKDTFGYHLSFIGGGIVDYMYNNMDFIVKDGELVRQWDHAKAAVEFKKKLFDAGVVDKDFLTDKGDKALQDFMNGKLGIYGMNGIQSFKNYETLRANNPDARITFIPFPTTQYGSYSWEWAPIQLTGAVNAHAKDPQAVMNYVDFLKKESTQVTLWKGIKDEHYTMGDNGCPQPIDREKNKIEVEYSGDLAMLSDFGLGLIGDCNVPEKTFDLSNPFQAEYLELLKGAKEAYLNPERPFIGFTSLGYYPTLPQDLGATYSQLAKNASMNTATPNTITSIYDKAVVGGSSYSVEQAMNDALAAWDKGGGAKVEAWYKDWYAKNKDTILTTEEIYEQYVK